MAYQPGDPWSQNPWASDPNDPSAGERMWLQNPDGTIRARFGPGGAEQTFADKGAYDAHIAPFHVDQDVSKGGFLSDPAMWGLAAGFAGGGLLGGGTLGGSTLAGTDVSLEGAMPDWASQYYGPNGSYNTFNPDVFGPTPNGGNLANLVNGGTVAQAATAGGARSLADRIFGTDTGVSNGDLTRLLGSLGAAGLSAYGSSQQANAFSSLADRYSNYGAPSRNRYEASFSPGFTMANDPGYADALNQTTKASLAKLSVNGNPVGSPNAWEQSLRDVNAGFAYPALQNYRTQNASAGGLQSGAAAAPQLGAQAINAQGQALAPFGGAIADIFAPPKQTTLADLLRGMR